MYIKTLNDAIDVFPYSAVALKKDNPLTSFPQKITNETLAEWGVYYVVRAEVPPSVGFNEKVVPLSTPTLEQGMWTLGWEVVDKTTEDIETEGAGARLERDELLTQCDWTQLPDSPLDSTTKASWAAYRTELRDVTEQSGFPTDITWPTAP